MNEQLRPDDAAPVFAISVAAQIAGLHPQTLRQYDRLGLVSPGRTGGRNRLYSLRDIARLREVSRLSAEGVNLAGIQRILALESDNERLRSQLGVLLAEVQRLRPGIGARPAPGSSEPSTALVVWRPRPADRDPRPTDREPSRTDRDLRPTDRHEGAADRAAHSARDRRP
ncbi:MAG TPA: helix-turn-helix transcriptional regulator [Candidatus Angelobacter sp.]|nr:helix-turn-helix transcriptional regulator [Candidatus Angelobacter sp.]